jgi:hypothetical protein
MESERKTLSYDSTRKGDNPFSMFLALALCAAGAYSWIVFFILNEAPQIFPSWRDWLVQSLGGNVFWIPWNAAVITAIISMCLYLPRIFKPTPWFVQLNLWINIPGLLLSLMVIIPMTIAFLSNL